MSKIKSVRIKKDFPTNNFKIGKIYQGANLERVLEKFIWDKTVEDYPEFFDIEYEPTLLKRPDGSLINEPEKGKWVLVVNSYNQIEEATGYDQYLYQELKKGNIFLTEDQHLAEKKAKMLSKQLEIQYEIDKLNAEEGWVAGWEDSRQAKFYLHFNYSCSAVEIRNCYFYQSAGQHMSRKTAETILEKYTQEELRQYLGIII